MFGVIESLCSPTIYQESSVYVLDDIHLCAGLNQNAICWLKEELHENYSPLPQRYDVAG